VDDARGSELQCAWIGRGHRGSEVHGGLHMKDYLSQIYLIYNTFLTYL
jgi:hypothetical protein